MAKAKTQSKNQGKALKDKLKSQAQDVKKNLDTRLLELTHVSLDQVKNKWSAAAQRLDIDQDLPMYLVGRILEKARSVRESLPGEDILHKTLERKQALQNQMVKKALRAKVRTRRRINKVKQRVRPE